MIVPLSGNLAPWAKRHKTRPLQVNQVNESGGLEVNGLRYQIELLIEDDAALPEEAIEAARSLIFNQNVVAIVGPMISRTAIPATIITEEAQIPMLLPNATNPEATLGKTVCAPHGLCRFVPGQRDGPFCPRESARSNNGRFVRYGKQIQS
jgi:branched-chain amino acid transport system substrate-binding protein